MSEGGVKAEPKEAKVFEMPWFDSNYALGGFAETGVARAQEGYDNIKTISENIAETLHEVCSSNVSGATSYGLKLIDISRANTASAIDFVSSLLGSKSMVDALSLSAAETRKAFDTAAAQNRELWGLAQNLAKETAEPIRKRAARLFEKAS